MTLIDTGGNRARVGLFLSYEYGSVRLSTAVLQALHSDVEFTAVPRAERHFHAKRCRRGLRHLCGCVHPIVPRAVAAQQDHQTDRVDARHRYAPVDRIVHGVAVVILRERMDDLRYWAVNQIDKIRYR